MFPGLHQIPKTKSTGNIRYTTNRELKYPIPHNSSNQTFPMMTDNVRYNRNENLKAKPDKPQSRTSHKHKQPNKETTKVTAAKNDPLKFSKMLRNTQVVEFDNNAFDEREAKKTGDQNSKNTKMNGSEALIENIVALSEENPDETVKKATNITDNDSNQLSWMHFPQNSTSKTKWESEKGWPNTKNELDHVKNIFPQTNSSTREFETDESVGRSRDKQAIERDMMGETTSDEHNILHVVVKSDNTTSRSDNEIDYGDKEYIYEDFVHNKNG